MHVEKYLVIMSENMNAASQAIAHAGRSANSHAHTPHTPASHLPESLRSLIERHREDADATRRLPEPLVSGLRDAGAFRLSTPRERGGFELPLAAALEVLEGFGHIDGSTAWVIWNLNLGFTAAFLSEQGVERIWSGESDPLIANSGQPGKAVEVEGGYLLTGEWRIVSGVDVADWVALFSLVSSDEVPESAPELRVCYVPRADLTVIDTWHVAGMRGTGSNKVIAENLFVPSDLTMPFSAAPRIDRPLYRLPLIHLVYPGCAAVVLGMARAAIDEVARVTLEKRGPDGTSAAQQARLQAVFGRATAQLGAARRNLFSTAAVLDTAGVEGREATDAERGELRGAISHAGEVARAVTAAMYEAAGLTALYESERIARLQRDMQVAAQHGNMSASHYAVAGRASLGLPSEAPFI